jgi:hypothetical protein
MLDELAWWTFALKRARDADTAPKAACSTGARSRYRCAEGMTDQQAGFTRPDTPIEGRLTRPRQSPQMVCRI